MNFQDDLEEDMKNTFFNPEEFASEIFWNEVKILAIREGSESKPNDNDDTFKNTEIFYIMKSYFEGDDLEYPEPLCDVNINDIDMEIKSVSEDSGCLTVEVERNDC